MFLRKKMFKCQKNLFLECLIFCSCAYVRGVCACLRGTFVLGVGPKKCDNYNVYVFLVNGQF